MQERWDSGVQFGYNGKARATKKLVLAPALADERGEMSVDASRSSRPSPEDPAHGDDPRSISDLVRQLTEQTQRLARQEVELAKVEVTAKGKQIGIGAGAFGAAGLVGLYAAGALTAAAILALATAVDGWLAALIVAIVYAGIAAALALIGKNRIDAAGPPVPEEAIASSKQDIETAKRSAKEARR